ncbi:MULTISPECIES: 16S rRNA (guanine(966)-N(2))-methyltransferase RsmD [unclassified Moritella]|uniref:16S rRNA (guanine(966)-N(2))-methyltransferase RsmD n=1 Tax=unclassified Moritella TaxID=2637987 RepID=UPI001BA8DAD5|nr:MULTISPECIES: 16S rRNA (guanine(966)-N(2))-methyltransferase RsmD [unclassified Moritella]QUM83288.1 16S rRNA (guanine(966)-N(2))-methyltransferase RsmD [Moritella sp. 28]QUM87590.1 16S rRNA (guanine(966)-N(2))-methyltransferase RsmD [Moritella sp. 36]
MAKSNSKQQNQRPSGQIRIISGQWRGRKLPVKDVIGLRPTTDRVKETVFNWLSPYVRDSHCLDLFAGSGGLIFEALSRYAETGLLFEKDADAAAQLQQNINLLKAENAQLVRGDTLQLLTKVPVQRYDLVFIDPPFRQALLEECCAKLEENNWLSADAVIYIEREKELNQVKLPANWTILKEKQAGQVCFELYQRQQ